MRLTEMLERLNHHLNTHPEDIENLQMGLGIVGGVCATLLVLVVAVLVL